MNKLNQFLSSRTLQLLVTSLILLTSTGALSAEKPVSLVTTGCMITGEERGSVRSSVGENKTLVCTFAASSLSCVSGGITEIYELPVRTTEVFLAKSKSGNVFVLGDVKKKSFSIASSHLIPEAGSLMTKHCTGKIQ